MQEFIRLAGLCAALAIGAIALAAPAGAKSKCNALPEAAACKSDSACVWIAASIDAKTGKQKRKAYCKVKSFPTKAKAAAPAGPAGRPG